MTKWRPQKARATRDPRTSPRTQTAAKMASISRVGCREDILLVGSAGHTCGELIPSPMDKCHEKGAGVL